MTGPMTLPGKRVQTINQPGSEVGPGTVATGEQLLLIKLMFLNIITNGKGVDGPATYSV